MKVLRQVFPKFPVSRSTLRRDNEGNRLTGHSHGAYITWGKETLKLSSFTPRDYPEKLVRDHGLKIRSISFVDLAGKKRESQPAGGSPVRKGNGKQRLSSCGRCHKGENLPQQRFRKVCLGYPARNRGKHA